MSHATLFTPLDIGPLRLAHRVVMAPLTRMRSAPPGNVPRPLNAEYYGQRASPGGLIIAEASQIVPAGQGVPLSPGIHSAEQIAGWREVTRAVHAKGGFILLQLWHVGRISHPSHQPDGGLPVSASAIRASGQAMTADFKRDDFVTPRALATDEIAPLVESYAKAARNAREAGFDGVEIHAANGYLLEQFLHSRSNTRTDAYGGPIENRARLVLEVVAATAKAIGADRTGIRLSPFGIANDSGEPDPMALYGYLIERLATLRLAYLHLIEPRASGAGQAEVDHPNVPFASELFRPHWPGVVIAAGNYRGDTAEAALAAGHADAVAFGRLFISNPDLPDRLRRGAALTPYDRNTFYGGDREGYTDYPALAAE